MKKILIIDDSRTVLAMMSAVLKGGGFEVTTAENGSDGYTKARDWKPDLIILDVMLPDTTGFDLLAKLKSDPACQNIPTAMLTSRDTAEDAARGLELGAVGYLVKHKTMPKLTLEKVKGWIG